MHHRCLFAAAPQCGERYCKDLCELEEEPNEESCHGSLGGEVDLGEQDEMYLAESQALPKVSF